MKLEDFTMQECVLVQQRMPDVVVLAGKKFKNLTVVLTMIHQNHFEVLYTHNDFKTRDKHIYRYLKDAFEDFDHAHVVENNF